MKKKLTLIICVVILGLNQSCWWVNDDGGEVVGPAPNSIYEPVIMARSQFETTTTIESPRAIESSGKIYVKDNFLFVNEVNQGFHVFNNEDPANPQNIAFLKVLGSSDIAIKDDMLYINNATDLLAISPNLSQNSMEITKRVENVFPQLWSPDGFEFYGLQPGEIIVDWTLIE